MVNTPAASALFNLHTSPGSGQVHHFRVIEIKLIKPYKIYISYFQQEYSRGPGEYIISCLQLKISRGSPFFSPIVKMLNYRNHMEFITFYIRILHPTYAGEIHSWPEKCQVTTIQKNIHNLYIMN